MMRRSFFLAITAAAVIWGSGAGEVRAGSEPLSELLGKTINIDGLNFTFDDYSSNSAPADQVIVTWPPTGSTAPGFTLTGAFGALASANDDSNLVYTITGSNISRVELNGNPQSFGTGLASVTDTVVSGKSVTGSFLGQAAIASSTTPGPVIVSFSPQTAVTVTKDIEALGGSAGVHLSSVTQTVPSVSTAAAPEPSSIGLLAIGTASLLAFRRLAKRRTPA
jgi:hypothetical protein